MVYDAPPGMSSDKACDLKIIFNVTYKIIDAKIGLPESELKNIIIVAGINLQPIWRI